MLCQTNEKAIIMSSGTLSVKSYLGGTRIEVEEQMVKGIKTKYKTSLETHYKQEAWQKL